MQTLKTIYLSATVALCALFGACGSNSTTNEARTPLEAKVLKRAKEDAAKILATDTATMAREDAILRAHLLANRLRDAGDSVAANLYIKTVKEIVQNNEQ